MIDLVCMSNNKTIEEILASMNNLSKAQMEENERTFYECKKYIDMKPELWPDFELLWDTSPEHYIHTVDGYNEESYKKHFPNGLQLGYVSFTELNNKLATHCVRTQDKIWELGSTQKLAKAILHWTEKKAMTPILIGFYKEDLIIGGGFHRHAVCIIKKPETIPILIEPSDKERLEKLLSIEWNTKK